VTQSHALGFCRLRWLRPAPEPAPRRRDADPPVLLTTHWTYLACFIQFLHTRWDPRSPVWAGATGIAESAVMSPHRARVTLGRGVQKPLEGRYGERGTR